MENPDLVSLRSARPAAEAALATLHRIETLEQAWEAWLELKLQHAAFRARCAEERRRIEQQGSFLVGAVRAAAQVEPAPNPASDALATPADEPLKGFLREAEQKLAGAREALERQLAEEEAFFADAFARIRDEAQARVRRILEQVRPQLRLRLRSIGAQNALLHLDRVGADSAVLLLHVMTGRIPSRYGYLFDDATDDATLPPPPLYPDEGVDASATRPGADVLRKLLEEARTVLPVKSFVPVFVPRPSGGEDFYRMLQRGPVMEVELQDGDRFRSILTREEGERFAGHLLRLKLQGRIDLELLAE